MLHVISFKVDIRAIPARGNQRRSELSHPLAEIICSGATVNVEFSLTTAKRDMSTYNILLTY